MWRPSVPDPLAIKRMRALREKHDLYPLAIHDSYLINLASIDSIVRTRSVEAFRAEIERALAIGAEYLVAHPGNYKGQSLEEGMLAFAQGLVEAAHGLKSKKLTILLENTAGCGAQIGCRFEELATLREVASKYVKLPIGFCIDTCHCLAAGYDVSSAEGLKATVRQMEQVLGIENIPVIHSNDSKTALGSRVDRHANIGEGHIGSAGFRRILAHPKLRDKAFILETPVDQEGDDRRNVEMLKRLSEKRSLARGAHTISSAAGSLPK
jgi:deoxyribonuclease-4